MKKFICLGPIRLFAATVFLLMGGILHAQDRSKDEASINKQVDAMIYSWNNHNYDDLKNYTTENTDWVNGVGMWWKGQKEYQYAHQAYHNTMFKESIMEKKSVVIRFVTKDVAIAHLVCHLSGTMIHEGKKDDPEDILETLVYVKVNGEWLVTAGVVVPIVKEVQQYDPVKQMPK
ncbi:SgcJ/EcaC family oxidoreductase [Terrimonas pollutisoli]|uniref:SgcJ/EcaC family oxidoreductase n=1 Tax=Terrimonas pollutisoli TaxID=3034147 RepID=UPI0023ED3E98|nr:SgcJ/EcaC family oxidoreductase [Terrimonas sp. H1YJ31]